MSDKPLLAIGRLGMWCSIPSTYSAEIVARSGIDWMCLDTQHGFLTEADLLPMIQASAITGTPCLVRVGSIDSTTIGRGLDAGAVGVVIPMVNSAANARDAVEACMYAPNGNRSWGPARLILNEPGYNAEGANDRTLCIPMIETAEAVANLDGILSVPGVRAVLVGTSDLAVDLGEAPRAGRIQGRHAEAMQQVVDMCRRHGVVAGTNCGSPEAASVFARMGYELLAIANDAGLLRAATRQMVEVVRLDGETDSNRQEAR
jgi:4-hydroxy-2-oxoheptanedioate aldolase